jgi:hypothetical protein
MTNPDLMARIMEHFQNRDENREPDPPLGPPREELLAALGLAAA